MLQPLIFAALLGGISAPPPREKEPQPPTDEEWRMAVEKMKKIGQAIDNYRDANGVFPADYVDRRTGKPTCSWRLAIVPYMDIGQDPVFKRLNLSEPWDGPTNKLLLEKMPDVYSPVRVKAGAGMTYYQGFAGKNAMLDPAERQKISLARIYDGPSNTCFLVEAGTAVEWTKPADIPFDEEKDLPRLGGPFDGWFTMLMCDMSVVTVRRDFHAGTMKSVVMRNDGKSKNLDRLRR